MLWYRYSVKKIYSDYHKKWLDSFEQVSVADKKGKNTKNAAWWSENELELLSEVSANPENNFAFFWRNWHLEVSQEWSIGAYQHTFEMEMDKVISRENNTDQFKENATKFKCINYFNNINASSFIKKCMI